MNTSPQEQLSSQPGFTGGAKAEQSRQQPGLPGLSLVKTGSVNVARTLKRLFPVLALCAGTAFGADLAEQNEAGPEQIEHASTTQAMAESSPTPHSVETEEWRLKAEQAQQNADAERRKVEEEHRAAAAEVQSKVDKLKAEREYHRAKLARLRADADHLSSVRERKKVELKLLNADNADDRKTAEAELMQKLEEELRNAEDIPGKVAAEEAKRPAEVDSTDQWDEAATRIHVEEATELKAEIEKRRLAEELLEIEIRLLAEKGILRHPEEIAAHRRQMTEQFLQELYIQQNNEAEKRRRHTEKSDPRYYEIRLNYDLEYLHAKVWLQNAKGNVQMLMAHRKMVEIELLNKQKSGAISKEEEKRLNRKIESLKHAEKHEEQRVRDLAHKVKLLEQAEDLVTESPHTHPEATEDNRQALVEAAKSCEECRRRLQQLPPSHTHPEPTEKNRKALEEAAKICSVCRNRLKSLPEPVVPGPIKCRYCNGVEEFPVQASYRRVIHLWMLGTKEGCNNCKRLLIEFKQREPDKLPPTHTHLEAIEANRQALVEAAKSCEECRRRLQQLPPSHTHPAAIEANREALKEAAKSCKECEARFDSLYKTKPDKCQYCKGIRQFPVQASYRRVIHEWRKGVQNGCKNCKRLLDFYRHALAD